MGSFKMALEAIMDKKGRSLLTMLGIIIGVGAVLILVTVVTGMNADMEAYYAKLGVNKVNLSVTCYDPRDAEEIMMELYDFVPDELGDISEGVCPADISSGSVLKHSVYSVDTTKTYFANEQFAVCNNYVIDKGREINEVDISQRSHVCVLGAYAADTLFPYSDPIGETIYHNGTALTVVGVYYAKDGAAESSMDDMVVLPYSLNRELLGRSYMREYTIKIAIAEDMEVAIEKLDAWATERIDSYTGSYSVENGNDSMNQTQDETTSLSLILAGVAAISLLVGGIGIMNIMLVTVTERTREIGIKKAIGAKRKVIINQFMAEAGVLSFLGGLVGIALGYIGSLVIGKAMYDLILLPSIIYVIAAAVFSIIIGITFGLYPAVKASGLQPVDALRAD